ncbi:MAG: hypothetical protein K5905_24390, partial [Roseibium sp.]|uniref:hypothetical protein n=1 Tax=Roseibium sp. TaxID=1936156 RepID=UPI002616B055
KNILTTSEDGTASVWDVSTGEIIRDFYRDGAWAVNGALSNDGSAVAIKWDDGQVTNYPLLSLKELIDTSKQRAKQTLLLTDKEKCEYLISSENC